jgi:hypothetical protein
VDPGEAAGPQGYEPVVELAIGRRKAGKSWKLRERAAELLNAGAERVFIHDPQGTYPADGLTIGDRGPNKSWAVLEGPEQYDGERVAVFRSATAEEVADWALPLNERGRRYARHPKTIVLLDEFDMVCSHLSWHSDGARDIVHYGRHNGLSILGSCRRPANVHRDMRALATRIYLFRLTDANDLDTIGKQWGEDTRAKVARLPRPRPDGSHYLTFDEDEPPPERQGDGEEVDPDDSDRGSGIEEGST